MKQKLRIKALALGSLAASVGFGPTARAEGSKNLTPGTNTDALTATTNDRTGFLVHDSDVASGGVDVSSGFLKPASWTSAAAGVAFSPDQRLFVRLLPGERLSYGVNRAAPIIAAVTNTTGAYQDLMLTLRYGTGDGTIVDQRTLARTATTGTTTYQLAPQAGVIGSYAQAAAGPGVAGGYTPLTYTNNTGAAQDFFVEFTQVGEYTSTGTQGSFNDLKTRSTTFNSQRYSVYDKWDFTVTGTDNQEKTGRLFSKFWAFSTGPSVGAPAGTAFENRLSRNFTLYPMVESRAIPGSYYVKAIELAGLRPYAFFFVTNEFGSTANSSRNTLALRRQSQTSNTAYAQYPSFVNDPDRAIWPSAPVPTARITPQPYCRSGSTEVAFTAYSSETGRFDITISYGGNTRVLSADVTAGTSATILWNGTVGAANTRVPVGQTISYNFVNRGVTVNFPLFDAEGNEGGFVVRNVRPSSAGTDLLYWDDTRLTRFTTTLVQNEGTNAAGAGHPWGDGSNTIGDNYLVNSWTYGFVSAANNLTYTTVDVCDNDGDGIADAVDIDDDNDGILDVVETLPGSSNVNPSVFADASSPIRYLDIDYVHPVMGAFRDVNEDGLNDIFDTDLDGIANHFDLDSDGDGLPDAVEANSSGTTVTPPTYTYSRTTTAGIKSSAYNSAQARYMASAITTAASSVGANGLPDAVKPNMAYNNDGTVNTDNPAVRYTMVDHDGDTFTGNAQTTRNYSFLDMDSDNDGISDTREAQGTLNYAPPTGLDTDRDGLDNAYDASPGGTALAGTSLTTAVDSDNDGQSDVFDADSDNDNTANGSKPVFQQTADWTEGFDTNGNGRAGDEIISKARAFGAAHAAKAGHYPVAGPGNSGYNSVFLQDSDNDKIPNFLDPDSPYYHDDNFNGLVDIYDPAYGGSASVGPRNTAGTQYLFRTNAAAVPLPVELAEFAARASADDALLAWSTASERNNDHFVVERSFDARTFGAVGTVRGQGSTARATAYRYTDAGAGRLAQGTAYYRLRQVDADGTASYGPIRKVVFGAGQAAVALYPNPSQQNPTLNLAGLAAGPYQVQVLDLAGRVLRTQQLPEAAAAPLCLDGLPPGSYVVRVQGAGISQALPLIRR